jgi:hypothetical protein
VPLALLRIPPLIEDSSSWVMLLRPPSSEEYFPCPLFFRPSDQA